MMEKRFAYMEAMAAGVPTIGTNAGGVPELITDGVTGHLVPPQDPASLAKTIAAVIADPQGSLDMAEAGRKHIEARFGADVGAEVLVREITAEVSKPVTAL